MSLVIVIDVVAVRNALLVAVTDCVLAAGGLVVHEYVFTPVLTGVEIQLVPRAGKV